MLFEHHPADAYYDALDADGGGVVEIDGQVAGKVGAQSESPELTVGECLLHDDS